MRAFKTILRPAEIEAVGAFVLSEFAHCRLENTRYHTPENGWPDHQQRYGAAYAYVSESDPSAASSDEGLRLYQEACTTCHEKSAGSELHPTHLEAKDHGELQAKAGEDHDEHYYPEGDDDGAPALTNLSPAERLGQEIYGRACAHCHGHDGTSRNSVALFLEPHPTDLTTMSATRRMTDEDLRRAIMDGLVGTSMPAFGVMLSPGEIDGLIAYVRHAFFDN